MRTFCQIISLLFLFTCLPSLSQNAQWLGPNRNGIYPDSALLTTWPDDGPEVIFSVPGLGKGFSSAVATEDMIFTTGTIDTLEYLTALNHRGEILWQKPCGRCWIQSFPEARSTPTIDGDRVYVLTGMDKLSCFKTQTGDQVWSVDLHETYGSQWDMFGVSESPLIFNDMVITTPAGNETTVVALNKSNGTLIWKTESLGAKRSNISPLAIEHFGKHYFITAVQTHLLGVDIATGKILWTYHYNFLDANGDNTTIIVNTPIYQDSCLWISNGWDVKSVRLEIAPDGKSVSERYADHTFDNQNHGMVLVDGFIYGSNFTGRQSGKWVCMNWHTGEIVWIEDWYNKGPVIYGDGMLYCYEEQHGNIALVKADPKEFKVISTFKVKDGAGPHWARPTIYYGMLLIRHGEYLIAYDINREAQSFNKEHIKKTMLKAASWQLEHPKHELDNWTNGAFYAGLMACYETTLSKEIYEALIEMGNKNEWKPASRLHHADDYVICQTYIDLYRIEKDPLMIRATVDSINKMIATPYPVDGIREICWWWCDALFMAPPTLVKLGITLQEDRYLTFNDQLYLETVNLLFNEDYNLFARDLNYVWGYQGKELKESNGNPIFWSRGNAWVMGGLARILKELPSDYPEYHFYIDLFRKMAEKVASLQLEDGLWRASLLDPDAYPGGEASGSGFYCYAFAWGINNGVLDRERFLPVVEKAWIGLNNLITKDGYIGWVQPIGADPQKNFTPESWEVFGTGAFLLAGSEVIKLKR